MTNNPKLILLLITGILVVVLASIWGIDVLSQQLGFGKMGRLILSIATLGGGVYFLYRFVKKNCAEPTLITIDSERLTMLNLKSSLEQQLAFRDIAAYRYSSFNSNEELRLTLRDGTKMKYVVSDFFHGSPNFANMVRHLEAVLENYQDEEEKPAVLREKTFFEKPISTVVLVAFVAVMAWMTWKVMTNSKTVPGSFFSSYGFLVAYLAAWYAGREHRRR